MSTAAPEQPLLPPAILAGIWMLGTVASFILMAVAARELTGRFTALQITTWRSIVGLLIVLGLLTVYGWGYARTSKPLTHLARNTIHFGAQWAWFYGVAFITLAEVFALEFTMPIWTLILAALILGEKITRWRLLSVLLGFIGVMLVIRPGFVAIHPAHFTVLASALGFAFSTYVITKSMVTTERPLTILFFMTAIQVPIGLTANLGDLGTPAGIDFLWIALTGMCGLTSHFCMARALALADSTVVVPVDFLRMPLVAVVGYILYNEEISVFVLFGAVLIFAGNFVNVWTENRRGRMAKAAATTLR